MRNFAFLLALVCGGAWAVNPAIGQWPLVGPGSINQIDVRAADAGAGPHEHFQEQLERRTDPPQEQVAAEKKAQAKKVAEDKRAQEKAGQKAGAGATR
jgi:hypothetical protein